MGSLLHASCPCGFESVEIAAGGGFMNFMEVLDAPAYCGHCKDLVVANYLDSTTKCPRCNGKLVFYNDRSLRSADKTDRGHRPVFEWNPEGKRKTRFTLPDTSYLCPKCGKTILRFVETGNWD